MARKGDNGSVIDIAALDMGKSAAAESLCESPSAAVALKSTAATYILERTIIFTQPDRNADELRRVLMNLARPSQRLKWLLTLHGDVRFVPESGDWQARLRCLLSAKSRLQKRKSRPLLEEHELR
jgi:hypothetical protein